MPTKSLSRTALSAATAHDDPRARAAALDGAAQLAFAHADFGAEQDYLQESLGIWRGLGQAAHVAQCLSDLGVAAHIRGEGSWTVWSASVGEPGIR